MCAPPLRLPRDSRLAACLQSARCEVQDTCWYCRMLQTLIPVLPLRLPAYCARQQEGQLQPIVYPL